MAQALRHYHDDGHGFGDSWCAELGRPPDVERVSCGANQMTHRSLAPFYVLGTLLGFALVIIGISLFQTFFPASPPITVQVSEYRAVKTMDGTIVISYDCTSIVHEDFEAHMHRTATHTETGLVIALPTTEAQFSEGQRAIQRQFYIQSPAPSGEYCITSQLEWRPIFSLTDRASPKRTQCVMVH